MSELINNSKKRKELLKHMILQLHKGKETDTVKKQLGDLFGQIPYGEVVEVEQELIAEGLPREEVIKLCDVHSKALKGVVEESEMDNVPPGHPVHTFVQENRALQAEIAGFAELNKQLSDHSLQDYWTAVRGYLNKLSDVDKHYRRKENLLFPYLEKKDITGPPTVMWGKHDEIREQLKAAHEAVSEKSGDKEEWESVVELVFKPLLDAL